jgi:hypothetical protein
MTTFWSTFSTNALPVGEKTQHGQERKANQRQEHPKPKQ